MCTSSVILVPLAESRHIACLNIFCDHISRVFTPSYRVCPSAAAAAQRHQSPLCATLGRKTPLCTYTSQLSSAFRGFHVTSTQYCFSSSRNPHPCIQNTQSLPCTSPHLLPPALLSAHRTTSSSSSGSFTRYHRHHYQTAASGMSRDCCFEPWV